jgi:hypothetical protein
MVKDQFMRCLRTGNKEACLIFLGYRTKLYRYHVEKLLEEAKDLKSEAEVSQWWDNLKAEELS